MLARAVLAILLAPAAAQIPADVDPLHARLLVVGDVYLSETFGKRLTRVLRTEMPTWKVDVQALDRVDAATVAPYIRGDDSVVVVAAGAEYIEVSTRTKTVSVGDLSAVEEIAKLVVDKAGRRCLWIGPPQVLGREWEWFKGAKTVSEKLSQGIRAKARGCEYIDSLSYTRGAPSVRYEDGLRLRPEPSRKWADEIADRLIRLVR